MAKFVVQDIPSQIQQTLGAGRRLKWATLRHATELIDLEGGILQGGGPLYARHDLIKQEATRIRATLDDSGKPSLHMLIDIADLWAFCRDADPWWEWCRVLCQRWASALGLSLSADCRDLGLPNNKVPGTDAMRSHARQHSVNNSCLPEELPSPRGPAPATARPISKQDLERQYLERVVDGRYPTVAEDDVWRKNLGIPRDRMRQLERPSP